MTDYPRWPDTTGFDLDAYVAGAPSMWERFLRRFNYLHRVGHADGIAPLGPDGLVPAENLPASPGGGAVDSVNGQTGAVVLDAADVGAVPATSVGAVDGVASLGSDGMVPSSQLPSTSGGITAGTWQNITLDSGFLSHADNFGYPPQYRLVGDRYEFRGIIRKTSGTFATAATKVATLPVGVRPVAVAGTAAASDATKSVAFWEAGASGPAIARWEVNPNGDVKVAASSSPAWVSLDGVGFATS